MTELTEIRDGTENFARLVATRPLSQWGQWTLYLLEVLDARAQATEADDKYTEMLASLRDAIAFRLAFRRWQKGGDEWPE